MQAHRGFRIIADRAPVVRAGGVSAPSGLCFSCLFVYLPFPFNSSLFLNWRVEGGMIYRPAPIKGGAAWSPFPPVNRDQVSKNCAARLTWFCRPGLALGGASARSEPCNGRAALYCPTEGGGGSLPFGGGRTPAGGVLLSDGETTLRPRGLTGEARGFAPLTPDPLSQPAPAGPVRAGPAGAGGWRVVIL